MSHRLTCLLYIGFILVINCLSAQVNDTLYNDTLYNDTLYNDTLYNDTLYNDTLYNDTLYSDSLSNDSIYHQSRYYNYNKVEDTLSHWNKLHIKYNAPYSIYEWKKYNKLQLAGWDPEKILKLERKLKPKRSGAFMVIHKGKVVAVWGEYTRRFHADAIKRTFISDLVDVNKKALKSEIDALAGDPPSVEAHFKKFLQAYPGRGDRESLLADLMPLQRFESPRPHSTQKPKRRDKFGNRENEIINELRDTLNTLLAVNVDTFFVDYIANYLRMEDFRPIDVYSHPKPNFPKADSVPPKSPKDFYFKISARDLARIGQMYLNSGKWRVFEYDPIDTLYNGEPYGKWIDIQILDPQWIEHATKSYNFNTPGFPQRVGYGYHWWIDLFPEPKNSDKSKESDESNKLNESIASSDSSALSNPIDTNASANSEDKKSMTNFSSVGRGGQLLAVFPEQEVVIVHLSDTYNSKGVSFRYLKKLVKHVFKAKQEEALTDKLPGEFLRHEFRERLGIIPISYKEIKEYEGVFEVLPKPPQDTVSISEKNKEPKAESLKIRVKLPENKKNLLMETSWMGNYYLWPIAKDVFLWEDARFKMRFMRDDGGKVSYVLIQRTE